MYTKINNLNEWVAPYNVEHFALISGGNTTNISDKTVIKKNFENNQKIDTSMVVNSLTKLINNVSNDVLQKNTSSATAAIGASNTIFISGIQCNTINISGIRQTSEADLETQVVSQQSNSSNVATNITSTIDKTIEKIGGLDLGALELANTNQLNDFMKSTPGYDPNKAQKLASKCPSDSGSLFSVGNKCNISTSYDLDSALKQKLELDDSFKINDPDDITNNIKNTIDQSNIAMCQSNASAENMIAIQEAMCITSNAASKAPSSDGTFNFTNIEQKAVTNLYMSCIFNQSNTNNIANKMLTKISKKYNQIYDAVEQKAKSKGADGLDYYNKATDLVDTLVASGMERIIASSTNQKSSDNTKDKTGDSRAGDTFPTETTKPSETSFTPQPSTKPTIISSDSLSDSSHDSSQWILYGGIGISIILTIIIVVLLFKALKNKN